jgi:hypothetical protein
LFQYALAYLDRHIETDTEHETMIALDLLQHAYALAVVAISALAGYWWGASGRKRALSEAKTRVAMLELRIEELGQEIVYYHDAMDKQRTRANAARRDKRRNGDAVRATTAKLEAHFAQKTLDNGAAADHLENAAYTPGTGGRNGGFW